MLKYEQDEQSEMDCELFNSWVYRVEISVQSLDGDQEIAVFHRTLWNNTGFILVQYLCK